MEVLQGLFVLLIALQTSPQGSVFCVPQIHITPDNPITKISSRLTLNCSSSCLHGKVKWKIMQDSVFASVNDYGHYSTMVFHSITEEYMSFICEEKCTDKKTHKRVKLYNFLGPTITTDPEDPQTGQPFQVKCEVKIHRDLSAELELTHGERVLSTQTKCADSYSSTLQTCEVSSEENILVSEAQYKCEATLRKDSSQRIESANLSLILREAALTTPLPTETTPLAKQTVAFPKETTPLRTETTPLAKETLAFSKETTPLPTASTTKSTASVVTERVTIQTDLLNTQSSTALKNESSSIIIIWVAVIICVVILALVICFVLFFYFKKRKEAQPQQNEGTITFCDL